MEQGREIGAGHETVRTWNDGKILEQGMKQWGEMGAWHETIGRYGNRA